MKQILKLFLACFLCLLSAGLIYALFAVGYPWLTEFNPEEKIVILQTEKPGQQLPADKTFKILTWNIGYAGLGKEMDFFYEGGKMVRPGKNLNQKYHDGIIDFIGKAGTADFMFLQEIDFRSKRSYRTNQFTAIQEVLSGYQGVSAINYQSVFVPSPILEPMGRVNAGMATFGKQTAAGAERLSTPGAYTWPLRLYMFKRCFLVTRYLLDNEKSLVLFNIHNSAFDDAAGLREKELQLLRELALEEHEKGNYVVIGGDWNQNPPGWEPSSALKYQAKSRWPIDGESFPIGWTWAYDPGLPTNRDVNEPFDQGTTTCTLLDYFLVSPNIGIREVQTIDLEFIHSDHLPVILEFHLL